MKYKHIAAIIAASSALLCNDLNAGSLESIIANSDQAARVYQNHSIHINSDGTINSDYELVRHFAADYELISKIAQALVDSDFRVERQHNDSFIYTNSRGEQANLEVLFDESTEQKFTGLYRFRGQRRFFSFDMILHLESKPDEDSRINYEFNIYATTDSRLLRIISNFSFVRRYFVREATRMLSEFEKIYSHMIEKPEQSMEIFMQHRDPEGDLYFTDQDLDKIRDVYESMQIQF